MKNNYEATLTKKRISVEGQTYSSMDENSIPKQSPHL